MKKPKSDLNDWLRPEYKRSDFGKIVRGKYAKRVREGTIMVVLDSEVAEAFPNDKAVNDALRQLISSGQTSARAKARRRTKKVPPKRSAA